MHKRERVVNLWSQLLTHYIKFNYTGFHFLPRQVQIYENILCHKCYKFQKKQFFILSNTFWFGLQWLFLSDEFNVCKTRHSIEFLSKYTTIDASCNRGKSATAVAGCSKKINRYFVQCQPYIMESEYTETIFMNIRKISPCVRYFCSWHEQWIPEVIK